MGVTSPPTLPMFSGFAGVLVFITALCREQTHAVGEPRPERSLEYTCSVVHSQNLVFVRSVVGKNRLNMYLVIISGRQSKR